SHSTARRTGENRNFHPALADPPSPGTYKTAGAYAASRFKPQNAGNETILLVIVMPPDINLTGRLTSEPAVTPETPLIAGPVRRSALFGAGPRDERQVHAAALPPDDPARREHHHRGDGDGKPWVGAGSLSDGDVRRRTRSQPGEHHAGTREP